MMEKLKTLKDIHILDLREKILMDEIRQEAIKWIKQCVDCTYDSNEQMRIPCLACCRDIWFNNLTEENSK